MPVTPRAVQRSHPPITVGGSGERYTLPLVERFADVWNVPTYALGELDRKVAVLRALCDDSGRDPATVVLSVEAVLAMAPDQTSVDGVRQLAEKRFGSPAFGLHEGGLIGTPPAIVDRLGKLHEMGFGQAVLFTQDRASDATLELLAAQALPHV